MKTKQTTMASALTGSALILSIMLTGCTSGNDSPSSEETVSASNPSIPKIPDTGQVVDNGKGKYLQSTISDSDPAMKMNREMYLSDAKALYSEEELYEAQKTVIRFIAEETIDSTVQGGGNTDEWFERNKNRFAPEYQDTVKQALKDPKNAFLINSEIRDEAGYDLKYDETSIRLENRSILLTSITKASNDRINVTADIKYKLKTNDGKSETVSGQVSYIVTQTAGNEWLISGHKNKVSIQAHNLETEK